MAVSRTRLPDLLDRVVPQLKARLAGAAPVFLGFSGGCDSRVLLDLAVAAGLRSRLTAVHVHHGLSPNADAWADFCRQTCAQLAVPFLCLNVAVDRRPGPGIEAAARHARYAAFVASLPAGSWLLLAQHRGDQAETLLFNLLRGTGVTGAAAIPGERQLSGTAGVLHLLRPMLAVSRGEIEAWARERGLRWVDDESNADPRFSRNFLRHQVMPQLQQRFPQAEVGLARAAANFAEAAMLLDELAAGDWRAVADGDAACLEGLRALSPARLKNLLRWRLRQLGWQVPVATRLEEFCRQLLQAGNDRHPALRLPAGVLLVVQRRLHWLPGE